MAETSNRSSLDHTAASMLPMDADDSDHEHHYDATPLVDRNGYHQNRKERIYLRTPRPRRTLINAAVALVLILFAVVAASTFVLISKGPTRDQQPAYRPPLRKALILASYKAQNTKWTEQVPEDWEIFRYVNDDPQAKYTTPIAPRHEAMAYLTFILDEYYRLPDYMIFSHGARASWHQPEPMDMLVDALNLTALNEDQYISARCKPGPVTGGRKYNLKHFTNWSRPAHEYLPMMWDYFELGEEKPEELISACCGQFAVTKEAIQARPYTWWENFRSPMFQPPNRGLPDLGDAWGFIYEQFWHVAFGRPASNAVDRDECMKRQWSYGVLCDWYPVPPLGAHFDDIVRWAPVKCFRNTGGIKDWPINLLTVDNYTSLHPS